MALPYEVTYTISDDKGKKSRFTVYMPDTLDLALVREYAGEFATRLDRVISGKVESVRLTLNVARPFGLKSSPLPVADVEEKMRLTYKTDLSTKVVYNIPTIKDSATALSFSQAFRIYNFLDDDAEALHELIVNAADQNIHGLWRNPVDQRNYGAVNAVANTKMTFKRSRS